MPSESAIIAMWQELCASERHFNELESRYRTLASTWLLAGFAAMGYVATDDTSLALPRGLLAQLIAAAVSAGIQILWLLDLRVYHRLLHACFLEGLRLECAHPELLPQVRTGQVDMLTPPGKRHTAGGVARGIRSFYALCAGAPLGIGAYALVMLRDQNPEWLSLLTLTAVLVCTGVGLWRMAEDPKYQEELRKVIEESKGCSQEASPVASHLPAGD